MEPAENEGKGKGRKIIVKSYNQKELAALYMVSTKYMKMLLDKIRHKIGEPTGRRYLVHQVEIIFDSLKLPYTLHIDDADEEDLENMNTPKKPK